MQPVRARRSSPKGVVTVTNGTPETTGVEARMRKRDAPRMRVQMAAETPRRGAVKV